MTEKKIYVTRPALPAYEEYCREIASIWENHWLTNMGEKHQELQQQLEEFLDVPHVTLFVNGHSALESILTAYQFPRGSEVITTPFTFASTTHAIVRQGLVPVFGDVREDDYTLDAAKIEALVTPKTVAILPVHVYGHLCDVEEIQHIADKYGLKVIYDAAHAFGVKRQGRSSAAFGDVSMFSFHATKVFNTIEGGALCYRDDALVQKLADWKNFGIHSEEEIVCPGGNAKMNEFQAAMGLCNLRHLPENILARRQVYEKYCELLEGVSGIKITKVPQNVEYNYAYCPVVFHGYKYSRDEVCDKLAAAGIMARKYFYPLTSDFACYRGCSWAGGGKTPVAQGLAQQVLTLPIYPGLPEAEVERICNIILAPLSRGAVRDS